WPRSDKYNDVGQPQKPSPPRTRTRIPTPISFASGGGAPWPIAGTGARVLLASPAQSTSGTLCPLSAQERQLCAFRTVLLRSLRGFAGRLRRPSEDAGGPVTQGPHSPAAAASPAPQPAAIRPTISSPCPRAKPSRPTL